MISIITPTYNRASLLPKAFESLCQQTAHDFEWIIIDDGSQDNTYDVIKSFLYDTKKCFNIRFIHQENGGRHRAINAGVKIAKGDFCILLDSDDYLLKNAVEYVIAWTQNLDDTLAGVSGLKIYSNGKNLNKVKFESDYIEIFNTERKQYGLLGDCAEVYRRNILLKYPFPEFQGENFISEVVCWNKIANDGYKVRWYRTPIYVCQYLDDGLSRNIENKLVSNPKGTFYTVKQNIKYIGFFERIKSVGHISAVMHNANYSYNTIAKEIDVSMLFCTISSVLYKIKNIINKK